MPGLISQIEQAVGGLDLGQLAGATGGQYQQLGGAIAGWNDGAPGDFGVALSGLSGVQAPKLSIAGNLGQRLGALLPSLQGDLGGLVGNLQGNVSALPQALQGDLLSAVQPLLDRIATLQTLLASDWTCGLVPALASPAAAPAAAPAPGPAPAPAPAPAAAPVGVLPPAQVTAARALVAGLPSDLSLPSLARWLNQRIGTVRPGYFTLRAIPLVDDLRDPLDTLVRWDAASAGAVQAELQQTIETLVALVRANSTQLLAVPGAAVAALAAGPLGTAAEAFVDAFEQLAAAATAQPLNPATLQARFDAVQGARAALLAQNAALAAAADSRVALVTGLAAVPAALDAGLCRLLVLLQPRAGFADIHAAIGAPPLPALPADVFAPIEALIQRLQDALTELLDTIDISAVTGPLGDALAAATQAVQAVEQGLAQLSVQAVQTMGQARTAIESIDLDALRAQAESALEVATTQVTDAVGGALSGATGALGDALTTVFDAMDAVDPEQLTAPIREAIDTLGSLLQQEAVGRLVEVLDQLEALAGTIATLSFAPVADEVIAAIDELDRLIQSIDIASLPGPGPALVGEAMAILPPSLVPLTDPLIAELDSQIAGSPTELLLQVKTLPDEVRTRLLAFSPRAALQPVLSAPFQQAVGALDGFDPLQWLRGADDALATLRGRIAAQMDIARLLAEPARAHAAALAELERFRPSALLQPLEDTIEQAVQQVATALPVGDLAAQLQAALDRIGGFSASLAAVLDVAEDLVSRLGALGDPQTQFEDWIDTILVKVPETPAGALAAALQALRDATGDAAPAALGSAWAVARQPLADAAQQAGAASRLTRLTLARSRLQPALAQPAVEAAAPGLSAWFADAATRGAGDGLAALAAVERALASTDAALQQHLALLAARFPEADGPLAALLPPDPATLREWVREALLHQLGVPLLGALHGVKLLTGLLDAALGGLRALVAALDAKIAALLLAPQALADLLGSIAGVQQRLASLDLGIYTREVDAVYAALLDELRALDPRSLVAPLEAARDRLLGLISLDAILPPALRAQLTDAHRQLVAKLASLDPDALLLEPLDEEYRQTIEPLVETLDIGDTIDLIIRWLNGLSEDLRTQIGRIDGPYASLLRSAPGGGGGGGSQGISL